MKDSTVVYISKKVRKKIKTKSKVALNVVRSYLFFWSMKTAHINTKGKIYKINFANKRV